MRVAAVQLTSTPDKERNLADRRRRSIAAAADAGAELIALPELFNGWGSARELRELAEPLDGPTITLGPRRWRATAAIWLLAGQHHRAGRRRGPAREHVVPDRARTARSSRPTARSTCST